ncbi:hypothetical protein ENBRE01_0673 [Enteropsectra breve]|nr:hypothetical protein ENBRE01_0673 [Enteropsectra breve]
MNKVIQAPTNIIKLNLKMNKNNLPYLAGLGSEGNINSIVNDTWKEEENETESPNETLFNRHTVFSETKELTYIDFIESRAESINRFFFSQKPKTEGSKAKASKIDFYKMFSEHEEDEISEQTFCSGLKNELVVSPSEKEVPSNQLCNVDFLLISLKNDLRVRYFKSSNGNQIFIFFWTVSDAVSFYKQYFNVTELRFAYLFEYEKHNPSVRKGPHESDQGFSPLLHSNWLLSSIDTSDSSSLCQPAEPVLLDTQIREAEPYEADKVFDDENSKNKFRFEQRVGYFEKMKGFYPKAAVKKLELAYLQGKKETLALNSKEISCGCFSNVVMQDAVRKMSQDELCEIIINLGYDIVPISATKYGAYTIQAIIASAMSTEAQELLSHYFEKDGEFLISHDLGNYAIQKLLRFNAVLVYKLIMRCFKETVEDPLGLKVFKKSVELFKHKKHEILELIGQIENISNSDKCKIVKDALSD